MGSSNSEMGGDGFRIPGRVEIVVPTATKPLIIYLKGKKILKSGDL